MAARRSGGRGLASDLKNKSFTTPPIQDLLPLTGRNPQSLHSITVPHAVLGRWQPPSPRGRRATPEGALFPARGSGGVLGSSVLLARPGPAR